MGAEDDGFVWPHRERLTDRQTQRAAMLANVITRRRTRTSTLCSSISRSSSVADVASPVVRSKPGYARAWIQA